MVKQTIISRPAGEKQARGPIGRASRFHPSSDTETDGRAWARVSQQKPPGALRAPADPPAIWANEVRRGSNARGKVRGEWWRKGLNGPELASEGAPSVRDSSNQPVMARRECDWRVADLHACTRKLEHTGTRATREDTNGL